MSETVVLRGKPVAEEMTEKDRLVAQQLREKGIIPTLAIVRVGEDPGDLAYERGA